MVDRTWTTGPVLVATEDAPDYGLIFEPVLFSLAWIGAPVERVPAWHERGLVVPQRNAVVLAELASLDALSGIASVGIGWGEPITPTSGCPGSIQ